jgi:glucose-1-phosphate thymidylyltransferase
MKGIVLAGGAGTRLHPLTLVTSKQLQPVYDKPMVYYPLSTLMLGGLRDLLLISTAQDTPLFEALLGDGSQWGVSISYAVQTAPRGLADALLVGEKFLAGDTVSLVLGDNIFYGRIGFDEIVRDFSTGALIFGYPVTDPERYGIVEFGDDGRIASLEEKPSHPRSNLAVPGLYLYDGQAVEMARALQPSGRGELEITDLNLAYHRQGQLRAVRLGRGVAWLDSGTHESLLESANFIATIERRQGLKIACLEEVAFRQGFIDAEGLESAAAAMPPSPYRSYVLALLDEEV